MQTFLPYPEFRKSAQSLDSNRLNKQIVEGTQILNAIKRIKANKPGGWHHHPCTKMWVPYTVALAEYISECIVEWEKRKGRRVCAGSIIERVYLERGTLSTISNCWIDKDPYVEPLHASAEKFKIDTAVSYEQAEEMISACKIQKYTPRRENGKKILLLNRTPYDLLQEVGMTGVKPHWLGRKDYHTSHQSNLLRKDPRHYSSFAQSVSDNLSYVWPIG